MHLPDSFPFESINCKRIQQRLHNRNYTPVSTCMNVCSFYTGRTMHIMSHLQNILWNKHLKFQSKLKLHGTNYLIESSWRTKGKRWFYRCKVYHLHWTTFVWLNFIQFEAIHNPEPFAYTVQSITYQLCNGVRNSNHWDIPYASHGCILWWFELEHTN